MPENVFDKSPYSILIMDSDTTITDVNPAALKLLEYKAKENLVGQKLSTLIPEKDMDKFNSLLDKLMSNGIENGFLMMLTGRSGQVYVEIQASCVFSPGGDCNRWFIVATDADEKKSSESELKYLSFHDKLTGLYNRAYFEKEIMYQKKLNEYPVSIIMGDMNGLKMANDIFGHDEGDEALRKVAALFKKFCRKNDTVARWGGDEFAVILPNTTSEAASAVCDRIWDASRLEGRSKLAYSISLGYAATDSASKSILSVLKEAEEMMYKRKMTESRRFKNAMLKSLSDILSENNIETHDHKARIKRLASDLAYEMGLKNVDLDNIKLLAENHDIGKITVKDYILLKSGKLNENEWEEVKKHSVAGYRIAEISPEISQISDLILFHHEKWDGTGYPNGLREKDIPLLCRILHMVDAYDVMISGSVYKLPISQEDAIEEIKLCSGTHFDPEVVKSFLNLIKNRSET